MATRATICSLLKKYVRALQDNIERRFEYCVGIFKCFDIFDPLTHPSKDSREFKEFGAKNRLQP